MNTFALLLMFCAAAFGSLLLVSFVNRQQAKARIIRHKLHQLRHRSEELEELVALADQTLESNNVARVLNGEVIHMLETMLELDSRAQHLETLLNTAQARAQEYALEQQERTTYRIMPSDAQIARAQHSFNEMGGILKRLHSQGRLSTEELQSFIGELSWAHLMVDALSHVAQGHKCAMRGDFTGATAFYNRAKQALVQNPLPDPRRNRMIKELGEITSGRRVELSKDLMHEEVDGFDPASVERRRQALASALQGNTDSQAEG